MGFRRRALARSGARRRLSHIWRVREIDSATRMPFGRHLREGFRPPSPIQQEQKVRNKERNVELKDKRPAKTIRMPCVHRQCLHKIAVVATQALISTLTIKGAPPIWARACRAPCFIATRAASFGSIRSPLAVQVPRLVRQGIEADTIFASSLKFSKWKKFNPESQGPAPDMRLQRAPSPGPRSPPDGGQSRRPDPAARGRGRGGVVSVQDSTVILTCSDPAQPAPPLNSVAEGVGSL